MEKREEMEKLVDKINDQEILTITYNPEMDESEVDEILMSSGPDKARDMGLVTIENNDVDSICGGFDRYIGISSDGESISLYDYQDYANEDVLGNNLKDVLIELSKFEEYFNKYPEWVTDFLYYL